MQFQRIVVDLESEGQRLDKFLVEKLKISRNQIQNFIKEKKIKLNKNEIKKSGIILKRGDEVKYNLDTKKTDLKTIKIPLDIIFENKDYFIINKEPGIAVHPDKNSKDFPTIINAVLAHSKSAQLVHRLDKDTSGALLIAKNSKTHTVLSALFKNRVVKKVYLALVKGLPKTDTGLINAPIKRDRNNRIRMNISSQGKAAISSFKVLESFKGSSLLEIEIKTGRTHQIRVHMASIGHPVIGDPVYGDKKLNKEYLEKYGLKRQFLHAKEISFNNKAYNAKLKKDLEKALDKLRTI